MKTKIFKTRPVKTEFRKKLNFNQGKIHGFSMEAYQQSSLLVVGCGGIGSNTALGPVRKGIKEISLLDGDDVSLNNLTRQLFHKKDIGKNKAICLAKHLSKQGFFLTYITAFPYYFYEALELGYDFTGRNAIFCGVDNNSARVDVSEFGLENNIPVIFAAVSLDGNELYCAIQEPEKACFGCIFPQFVNDHSNKCNIPGIIDVLQIVAGFMNFALDTIICNRYREWNLIEIALSGVIQPRYQMIEKNKNCELCGESKVSESKKHFLKEKNNGTVQKFMG